MPAAESKLASKPLRTTLLRSAHQHTRQMVKREVDKGAAQLEATVRRMTADAERVLAQASACGPQITGHLDDATNVEKMPLAELEVASRVWERMLTNSRKILRLDQPEAAQATVRVGVMVSVSPAERQPDQLADGPVIDAPTSHQPS